MRTENSVRRENIEVQLSVPRLLSAVFLDDQRFTLSSHSVSPTSVEVFTRFPKYGRVKIEMHHVSAVQIHAAVLEGFYCALENAVIHSDLFPAYADLNWFLSACLNDEVVLFKNHVIHRRMIKPETIESLVFTVNDVTVERLRRKRLMINLGYDGYCSGELAMLIDTPIPEH